MQLLSPSEISGRVLSLMEESDQWVIIVSPYIKISKWYKFQNGIKSLISRDIVPDIYVRDDPENSATYRDLDNLDLKYTKLPFLHCKFYLNENRGIVTSMNLLLSSEINALEIGYITENRAEHKEILNYYHRYIYNNSRLQPDKPTSRSDSDIDETMLLIREELNQSGLSSWLWFSGSQLHINVGRNDYTVSINDGYLHADARLRFLPGLKKRNIAKKTTDIAKKRAEITRKANKIAKKAEELTAMKIELLNGAGANLIHLTGHAQRRMKSVSMSALQKEEEKYLVDSIKRFIEATDSR